MDVRHTLNGRTRIQFRKQHHFKVKTLSFNNADLSIMNIHYKMTYLHLTSLVFIILEKSIKKHNESISQSCDFCSYL